MKKIGIALTLLAVATSACAESPTASAAGVEGALNEVFVESGHYEEAGFDGTGSEAGMATPDGTFITTMELRGPGLAGSGH